MTLLGASAVSDLAKIVGAAAPRFFRRSIPNFYRVGASLNGRSFLPVSIDTLRPCEGDEIWQLVLAAMTDGRLSFSTRMMDHQ